MRNNIVNMSLQVIPLDCGDKMYHVIDEAIGVIRHSGVQYQVGPFETVMEGLYDELISIVKEAQETCFEHGAGSIVSHVKIEWHSDRAASINEKTWKYNREPEGGVTG